MKLKKRGRILRVAPGYNPNSSSLGVDVSFLLFGSMAVTAVTLVVSTALRLWRQKERAEAPKINPEVTR
jgi:hypothetical protein